MTKTYTAQSERFSATIDQIKSLLQEHYHEVGWKGLELDIDWEFYIELDLVNHLRCYTLRCDGALVGYWIGIVRLHPHYKSSLTAFIDSDYIVPSARGCATLLRHTLERELKAEGVRRIIDRAKPANRKGEFLTLMGYESHEVGYVKTLG